MNRHSRFRTPRQVPAGSSIEVLESRIAPATFVVLNLNDSGAGSLRDAIDQANAQGGPDTILFHTGLHGTISLTSGELKITDEVTIKGPGGNKIILDGLNQSRIFLIDDGTTTDRPAMLSGLTIIDGNSTGDTAFTPSGGGIVSTESLTLKNCVVSGNTSVTNTVDGNGGGVAVFSENAGVNIVDTQVTNNVGSNGGGLYLYAGKSITINGSKISNNHGAGFGGGGAALSSDGLVSSEIVVENTVFQGNVSGTSGGGLSVDHNLGGLTISGCQVIGNTATSSVGGGMEIVANGNVVVEKTSVTNNRSLNQGGGIFSSGSAPVEIFSSKISGNQVTDGGHQSYGGGIYFNDAQRVTISNSTISGNSILPAADKVYGGGIAAVDGVALTISHSQISNNIAANGGGGIFTNTKTGPAGSLALNNDAISGNSTFHVGGGIDVLVGTLNLSNTLVSGNTAPSGGGIYSDSSGALTIAHSTFSQNLGQVQAGGIEISGTPNFSITNSLFSANETSGLGGGIENFQGTGTIVATRFVNNIAESGGGIHNGLGTVTASHVSFSGNVGGAAPEAVNVGGVAEPVSDPHGPAGAFTVTNLLDDGSAGSLRSVIEAADALPGPHTISFQAGLTGAIQLDGTAIGITGPLTIKGPGANKVAVDGRGISQIFDIDDGDPTIDSPVNISGLAFADGKSNTNGGAIFSAESLTLSHSVITGSLASADGGAVAVMALDTPGSTVKIVDSMLLGNKALESGQSTDGGGLAAFVAKSVAISGSQISGNNATYGGGVYAVVGNSGAGITISGTTFAGNIAHFGGGILAADPNPLATSKVQILDSNFHGNLASNEGAGVFAGKGNFVLRQTKFLENSSANGGGGFFGKAFTSVSIVNSVLSGNLVTTANQSGGAALYVYASAASPKVTISASTVSGNQSATDGGGIVAGGDVSLMLASDKIDANGAPDAAGVYLFDKTTTSFVAKIVGGELVGNVASGEGSGALEAITFGAEQGSLTIAHAKITANSGGVGAGILTQEIRTVTITNTVLSGNLATPVGVGVGSYISFGGAAEFQGPSSFTISGCSITANIARDGGGLDLDGVTGSITKTKITGNFAAVLGGAINEQNNPQVTLDASDVISGNVAPTDAN